MDGTAQLGVESATARLPERQREALELRERGGLTYEEIAVRLGTSREAVPQLMAHARINLYDELHGTILASVAPSPDCERALGLIAARQDGELEDVSAEATWLDRHLEDCGRCRRGVEEMGATPTAYGKADDSSSTDPPRRRALLAVALAGLLLFGGVATAMRVGGGPGPRPADPTRASREAPRVAAPTAGSKQGKLDEGRREAAPDKKDAAATAGESGPAGSDEGTATTAPAPAGSEPQRGTSSEPASPPKRSPGKAAVNPPRATTVPQPSPAPSPAPSAAPPPAPSSEPAPVAEEPAPTEEPSEGSRRREPPGKPAHLPRPH
jgi:hypothetical protein